MGGLGLGWVGELQPCMHGQMGSIQGINPLRHCATTQRLF